MGLRHLGLLLPLAACAHPTPPDPLAELALPARPLWMDKYSRTPEDMGIFLQIDEVMRRFSLDRLQAVEVQNHLRDALRADPTRDVAAVFDEAVARVRAGELESGIDRDDLAAAPLVVVFDLDDTLYDQYYDRETAARCHDLEVGGGESVRYIHRNPGWELAFEAVRELGGRVVLFSANVDEATLANLRAWTWEGRSLLDHPDIAGVLTNSHLVLQDKAAGPPVIDPSKDLRLFDPELGRVWLVDDNPTRVFQPRNLRLFPRFDAEVWCGEDGPQRRAMARAMGAVAVELAESALWLADHPEVDPATAWLPYSWLGTPYVEAMMVVPGMTRTQAVEHVRTHPDEVPARF